MFSIVGRNFGCCGILVAHWSGTTAEPMIIRNGTHCVNAFRVGTGRLLIISLPTSWKGIALSILNSLQNRNSIYLDERWLNFLDGPPSIQNNRIVDHSSIVLRRSESARWNYIRKWSVVGVRKQCTGFEYSKAVSDSSLLLLFSSSSSYL